MCIFKLRLETENPDLAGQYAEKFHGLREYPIKMTEQNIHEFIKSEEMYRKLLTFPTQELDEDNKMYVRSLSTEEKQFLCDTITNGFYEFVSDNYQRNNFSVDVVDNCDGKCGNGKIFYVFPTAYNYSPIIKF